MSPVENTSGLDSYDQGGLRTKRNRVSKRAVLYARVSTDEQADKGYSLPSQLELCRKYAERLGYSVVAELKEDYSGAVTMPKRPEGKKLEELIKRKQVDAIIAYQIDRLYRDHIDLLVSVRRWLQADVEIYACDIGKVESEYDIVLLIKGWQGSDERKKIMERTMRGKHEKARSGKVVGSPIAPYGYGFGRDDRGKAIALIVVDEEARVVKLIYCWYVHGDEAGKPLSASGIARKLSQLGIPTPGESRGMRRKRDRAMWDVSVTMQVIKTETYIGVWRFDGIAVDVPAIVDRELWDAAQARIAYNQKMAKRNCRHDYLLRGMIECGCGSAMGGRYKKSCDHRYYDCLWDTNHHVGIEHRVCHQRLVRADVIEEKVWGYIEKFFFDAEQFERSLQIAQQNQIDNLASLREELLAVEQFIAESEADAAKLAKAYTDISGEEKDTSGVEGREPEGVVRRALKTDIKTVEARHKELTIKRDNLAAELNARHLTDERIQAAMRFRESVIAGMQNPTLEDKRKTLEMLGVSITVKDKQAWVSCVISPDPKSIELAASIR